jgi:hypothetical protein
VFVMSPSTMRASAVCEGMTPGCEPSSVVEPPAESGWTGPVTALVWDLVSLAWPNAGRMSGKGRDRTPALCRRRARRVPCSDLDRYQRHSQHPSRPRPPGALAGSSGSARVGARAPPPRAATASRAAGRFAGAARDHLFRHLSSVGARSASCQISGRRGGWSIG